MENKREILKNALREFVNLLEGHGIYITEQSRIIREILDRFAPLQWCIYCDLQKQNCRCELPYYVTRSKLGKDYIIFCNRCGVNEKNHTCGKEDASLVLQGVHTLEQVQA